MKRGLLLEFILGGGLQSQPDSEISSSFRSEGWAMISTIAQDWQNASPDDSPSQDSFSLIVPVDRRALEWFPEIRNNSAFVPIEPQQGFLEQWCEMAMDADQVIVIAPECDGILARVTDEIDRVTNKRVGCRSPFMKRACDKFQTAQLLGCFNGEREIHSQATLHPLTYSAAEIISGAVSLDNHTHLWVMKLIDGAGCESIYRGTAASIVQRLKEDEDPNRYIVQAWRNGIASSVAVWVSGSRRWWMPPVHQRIEWLDCCHTPLLQRPFYQGGDGPLPQALWNEVHRFGNQVLDRLGDGAGGWIGIDFVYQSSEESLAMTAIEINPRWTTSYVGIRNLYRRNLLQDLLRFDREEIDGRLGSENESWRSQKVCWNASGGFDISP